MRRYLALGLACVLAAISASAMAMGLGEIRLNSYLNQRLDAEIELVSAAADELESLKVSLADRQAFQRYGLERDAILGSLQFRVVRRPNGTSYLKVTSSEPIREPFLTFLIEADWSRGRVLREYTVLLDPPTFASREQAPEPANAQAPAIAAEPERRAEAVEPRTEPRPAPTPEEPVQVETQEAGDVVNIPSLDEEAAPRRIPGPAVEPGMGENYGPIQRNETLWGIAQRLRPDSSVTINQMMVAIYRANPEAFQGNINRLKAGYILRVPSFSDVSAITRGDAFREVKRQNEEWRAGSRPAPASPVEAAPAVEPEPELSLVAPEEDLDADTGMGAGVDEEGADIGLGSEDALATDIGEEESSEPAMDLGVETETPERLLDVEDEAMQALQAQNDLADDAQAVEPPPLPGDEVAADVVEEPTDEQTEAAVAPAVEPAAEEAAAQEQADKTTIAPVRRPEPTLVEKLTDLAMSPLGLGIVAAILVLFLAGFLVVRKRREAARAAAAAAAAEWDENASGFDIDEESDDATVLAVTDEDQGGSVFAHDMQHEDTGTTRLEDDAEATQLLDRTQIIQPDAGSEDNAADETPAEASAAPDDFADTVFGGQSVTLDDNDPLSEADFHMAYGLYDQAAEVVQKAVQRDPSRKDYLAKLAEIHFSSNNTEGFVEAAGRLKELAEAGEPEWDNVVIMGRQIAPDNDLFAEGGGASSVDLDFGSAEEEFAPGSTAEPADNTDVGEDLDFDIPMEPIADDEATLTAAQAGEDELDIASLSETEDTLTAGGDAEEGMDFDLDLGESEQSFGGLEDSDDNAETASAEESNDFDFDLGDLGVDDGASALDDEPTQTAGSGGYEDDNTQTEFDKALEELSAFVDTNVPEEDAGDAVDAGGTGDELSLDDYSFDQAAAEKAADEMDLEGTGEDEEDIGEIGTKLDLARAYIDMGDPDGARSILEEVVSDGDTEQQQEARELLEQLA